jgi:hypothetical protein
MNAPTGGYFQIGRENDFPWWSTDRMTWYFTVDKNGEMKGYTPSKTNKKFLVTYLEANPTVSLFGVWTGKYSTSIFAFDSKISIEKLKGEL